MRKLLVLPIRFYQYAISPLMASHCRHYPTCSVYALDALKLHGPGKGSLLAAKRILRCHPWGTHGIDPVPLFFIKRISLKKYGPASKKVHPACDRLKQ